MFKISVIILTKNRAEKLRVALDSVARQSLREFEVVVVNDGSTDSTLEVIEKFKNSTIGRLKVITHEISQGITASRQEALQQSTGEYVAILDDDDEWVDPNKLKKQAEFLDKHPEVVLCGGGIKIAARGKHQLARFRPQGDGQIRRTMLLRNNFFTSTVMFRRQAALAAGGFVSDAIDLGEDYDLWLRLGQKGKMANLSEVFTIYRQPDYNKERFAAFLRKQNTLVQQYRRQYPYFWLSRIILTVRMFFKGLKP